MCQTLVLGITFKSYIYIYSTQRRRKFEFKLSILSDFGSWGYVHHTYSKEDSCRPARSASENLNANCVNEVYHCFIQRLWALGQSIGAPPCVYL